MGRTVRALALALAVAIALPAEAKKPATRKLTFGGRVTSYVGLGLMGVGGLEAGLGGALGVYRFSGPYWDKPQYDRAYLGRAAAADVMLPMGLAMAGAGVPLLMVGPLVEVRGLRRITRVPEWPGWTGVGLAGVASTMAVIGIFTGGGLAIAALYVVSVGFGFSVAQFGVNAGVVARRLTDDQRQEYYGLPQRGKVAMSVAPVLDLPAARALDGSALPADARPAALVVGGLALTGRF